jgi:hypothetical protein
MIVTVVANPGYNGNRLDRTAHKARTAPPLRSPNARCAIFLAKFCRSIRRSISPRAATVTRAACVIRGCPHARHQSALPRLHRTGSQRRSTRCRAARVGCTKSSSPVTACKSISKTRQSPYSPGAAAIGPAEAPAFASVPLTYVPDLEPMTSLLIIAAPETTCRRATGSALMIDTVVIQPGPDGGDPRFSTPRRGTLSCHRTSRGNYQ